MMTLVDKAILSGADNRPPMLEKDMYDSWKSIMELYIMNRQHGRMILESVEHGPLIWPMIEENGVTRPRKYLELTPMDAIQADCDVKATNIILQGLPPEERECKLYDEFDKFAYKKRETLRDFYLRISLLLNDMNIYNVKLEQFQANTKFLNTLPPDVNDTLTAKLERYKEQVKVLKEGQNVDLKSKDNVSDSCEQSVEIDRLKQTLSEHLKENESLMQTVTLLKNDFKKEESRNIDREIALEKKIKQLDNIVYKRDQSAQTVHMLTKPQFFYDHTTKKAPGFQNPFYLKKAQ
ncbi:hypothetical protein Tco_0440140 [Tanacetum coccineum]